MSAVVECLILACSSILNAYDWLSVQRFFHQSDMNHSTVSGGGSKNAIKTFHKGRWAWQSFWKANILKKLQICNLIHLHIYGSEIVMFYGKPHWMLKNTANVFILKYGLWFSDIPVFLPSAWLTFSRLRCYPFTTSGK